MLSAELEELLRKRSNQIAEKLRTFNYVNHPFICGNNIIHRSKVLIHNLSAFELLCTLF